MQVTNAAVEKVLDICTDKQMPAVRAFVMGFGCAGMQHNLTFAEEKLEHDVEVAPRVYVDPVAMFFFDNSTLDYSNSKFVFTDVWQGEGGGKCGGCGYAGH